MLVREILNELFDTRGVQWVSPTMATFDVGSEHFAAYFNRDAGGGNYYSFFFVHEDGVPDENGVSKSTFNNTGKLGSAGLRVFGYALQALEEFIAKNKPQGLEFTGFEKDGRVTLYTKMIAALDSRMKAIGYKITSKPLGSYSAHRHGPGVTWRFTRPDMVKTEESEEAPTIADATEKNGYINRKTANKMVDPKGYFHPKKP